MLLAADAGIPILDFWEMTPGELIVYAEAHYKRREAESEERYHLSVSQAYLVSRWVWQKRVNVKKLLDTKRKEKAMDDRAMLNKVIAMNAQMGGAVTKA
ncbi:MAG: hypothetical protein FWG28_08610 [Clostridiales bacterium]|nr:hypothetical protein [Clostridiales bacterium]